jgi:hydrogenase expression/formation protein HypE
MFAASPHINVLRDPTRGGLATALNEIAKQSEVAILLDEKAIPVSAAVEGACEMLGFDPLYVANEGKLVAFVPSAEAEAVLEAIRAHPYGKQACRVGVVEESPSGKVLMRTAIGGTRVVDMLAGEMLPRIC